jgi:hypothetical protein
MSQVPRPLKWPPIFPLDKGLVLWLPFDDRSGAVAYDRSGKRNHATLYNATWAAGRRGSALSLNGSTTYGEVADAANLRISEITVEVLLNPSAFGNNLGIIERYISSALGAWYIDLDVVSPYNKVRVVLIDLDAQYVTTTSAQALTLNVWSLIGFTYKTNLKVYVDGQETAGAQTGNGMKTPERSTMIGRNRVTGYVAAKMGWIRIYNRALSAAEMKRHVESELMLVRS